MTVLTTPTSEATATSLLQWPQKALARIGTDLNLFDEDDRSTGKYAFQSTLSKLTKGSLTVVDIDGTVEHFNAPSKDKADLDQKDLAHLASSDHVDRKQTTLFVHDDAFYVDLLLHADIVTMH